MQPRTVLCLGLFRISSLAAYVCECVCWSSWGMDMVDRECIPDTLAASLIEHFKQPRCQEYKLSPATINPKRWANFQILAACFLAQETLLHMEKNKTKFIVFNFAWQLFPVQAKLYFWHCFKSTVWLLLKGQYRSAAQTEHYWFDHLQIEGKRGEGNEEFHDFFFFFCYSIFMASITHLITNQHQECDSHSLLLQFISCILSMKTEPEK